MRIFLYLIVAITLSKAAWAQTPDDIVAQAEKYLNDLKSVKASFVQNAEWSDADALKGTFYLKRPGKLRFDYNAPIEDFVVADGTFIYYYDAQMEQQSNAPIGSTLADFILRDPIRLGGDVTVSKIEESRGEYFLTLVQTNDPASGSLTLVFNKKPYALSRWIVVDTQGFITKVSLANIQTDVTLDKDLFYFIDPKHGKIEKYN